MRGAYLLKIDARFVDRLRHDRENLGARFFRAHRRFGHDFVAHARKFEVELESSDALLGSANFVIHVSEMIFGTDDVGQQFVAFHLAVVVVFRHETDANSSDRRLDRNARVHQREHAAANARHRAGAIRFHDLARDADRVTEIVRARNNRLERTLGQRAVTNFATARAAGASGFADAERREVVMK